MRVGYLSSRYPAISHTFILREVEALRRIGVEVETLSIRRARPEDLLSEADRAAFRTTFSVLPTSGRRLLGAQLEAFLTAPSRYLKTLRLALGMASPGLKALLWQLFYFAEAMIVWQHCRRAGVRHLHASFAAATDSAMLAAHFGGDGGRDGAPWSWSLAAHGPVEFYDVSRFRLVEKVRRARFAIAISDFGRSQLMTLVDEDHWGKIHVVRCGLDPSLFTAGAGRSTDGDPTGARERAPTRILCVGRLIHLKGHAILIEAIAELAHRGIPVEVTLAGDGPKRSELERLATKLQVADRITFMGAVGQDRIHHLYSTADVFCLPSFAEGLPVVLMEAMAVGTPVVATRVMAIPELVEDKISGLLVPPGRVDALAQALERLAEDHRLRAKLSSAAREKVVAEFDVNRSAKRLRDIFERELS